MKGSLKAAFAALLAPLAALLLLAGAPALAEPPPPPDVPLANPAQEARAKSLMFELRCLTCQNQSIAESNAGQAQAMRQEVRQLVAAGKSAEEVRGYFIERYGDWVSFRPPTRTSTIFLWAAPLFFLLMAGAVVWHRVRR